MAFVSVPASWVDVDSPLTDELFGRIKDNEDFLNAQTGGEGARPSNGSFEIDSDSDGTPDNWTLGLAAGGAGVISSSTSVHGTNSFLFTAASGAGNGGGSLVSDTFPINNVAPFNVAFSIKREPSTGGKNEVRVTYYDGGLATIATTTIYSATSEPTTAWIPRIARFSPPASAVHASVSLIGGTTDVDASGLTYYDNVFMTNQQPAVVGDVIWAQSTNIAALSSVLTKEKEIKILTSGQYRVEYTSTASGGAGATATVNIYRNGSAIGTETSSTTVVTYSEDLDFIAGDLAQLYGIRGDSTGAGVKGFFLKTDNGYIVNQAS